MEKTIVSDSSRAIRKFSSHEEQETADLLYWRDQPVTEKLSVVAELAEYFAAIHKIGLDAQGPKRVVVRVERARR